MRLFVAIELDAGIRQRLARIRELPLEGIEVLGRRGVRWVREAQMHLTLRFLGDVEETRIIDVTGALRDATQGRRKFSFSVVGLGGFPSWERARVLWAGVQPATEVAALAEALEQALVARGFSAADRAFSAHVTVARVNGPLRGLRRVAASREGQDFGKQEVHAIALIDSTLTPEGPRYRTVCAAPLED